MRAHYIVAYDIRDPARLRRVHKTLRNYGDPLQYSVFACQLSTLDQASLESELCEIIHHEKDQVMFLRLGPVRRGDNQPPGCSTLGATMADLFSGTVVI